jgi:ACS family hexuronate transporter-like MFS transporter
MTKRSTQWGMLGLLFSAAVINYLDRQALSVAAPVIRQQYQISPTEYAQILSAFMLAYALMHPIAGKVIDMLGTYRGFSLAVSWWSLACAGHAFATGIVSFSFFRFLLGMGESGLLPASIKAVSEWFSKQERAFAVGIINIGIGVGGILAPPLIAGLILLFDWRIAFLISGALGFLWLGAWMLFHQGRRKSHQESEAPYVEAPTQVSWRGLLSYREVWGLMAARLIADSAWYFYLFWLPEYLSQERGFSIRQIGTSAWVPYLTACLGSFTGGFFSDHLIKRGWSVTSARKIVMVTSALLMPTTIFAAYVQEPAPAIALMSLATFLIQVWATNLFTLPSDLFSSHVVASVYGFSGFTGSLSAMIFMPVVGAVVETYSYTPIFIGVGLLHLVATGVVLILIPGFKLMSHEKRYVIM